MLTVPIQLRCSSIGYLVVVLLVTIGAVSNRAWTFEDEPCTRQHSLVPDKAIASRTFLWIVLAACASALWLAIAIANYLSRERTAPSAAKPSIGLQSSPADRFWSFLLRAPQNRPAPFTARAGWMNVLRPHSSGV